MVIVLKLKVNPYKEINSFKLIYKFYIKYNIWFNVNRIIDFKDIIYIIKGEKWNIMTNNNKTVVNYYDYLKGRGTGVILQNLQIFNLYNIYDYEVKFNEDVTFIYGDNGCGKTTILDIVTNIITGRIDKLFKYTFNKIVLTYKDNEDIKGEIIINYDVNKLMIEYNGRKYILEEFISENITEKYIFRNNNGFIINDDNDYNFFENNRWAQLIKDSFNFIYLPISRKSTFESEFNHKNNDALNQVQEIIENSYMNIIGKVNNVNEQFKTDVFKTVFDSTFSHQRYNTKIEDLNNLIRQNSKGKILKMLEELGLTGEGINNKINSYYNHLEKLAVTDATNLNKNDMVKFLISGSVRDIELFTSLGSLADKLEIQKKNYMEPIEKFVGIINEFFDNNNLLLKKEIEISKSGKVSFSLNSSSILLKMNDLSSGEKQIFIFFAYLIFSINDKEKGIFIVDEPELSLHLEWQQKYIPSILKLNKQIQLIFATHSPEIINKYRKKMYKLIPCKSNLEEI